MKFIAHRGLTQGPNFNLENKPEQIEKSLAEGYDCEVDLWLVDSVFYLGHNKPEYAINERWLQKTGLWIHAKNLEALKWLTTRIYMQYFWHQEDDFTLTSHNYIWTYPGKETTERSIIVMPERFDKDLEKEYNGVYGICSYYVEKLRNKYDTK